MGHVQLDFWILHSKAHPSKVGPIRANAKLITGRLRKSSSVFEATASPLVAVAEISGFVAEVSEKYGVDE